MLWKGEEAKRRHLSTRWQISTASGEIGPIGGTKKRLTAKAKVATVEDVTSSNIILVGVTRSP